MRRPVLTAVVVLATVCALASCGKKASPVPPGPSDQITYPKFYPTQ